MFSFFPDPILLFPFLSFCCFRIMFISFVFYIMTISIKLYKLCHLLKQKAVYTVSEALVIQLHYCNAFFIKLSLKAIWNLIHNAQLNHSAPQCAHITLVLGELRWLPIGFWDQFKVLLNIFQTLHSSGPGYLWDWTFPIRSAYLKQDRLASCPITQRLWMGAFSIAAPSIGIAAPGTFKLPLPFWHPQSLL